MTDHPPTIIVVHHRERRAKCTVHPLRGQEGFIFWKYPQRGPESLENYVRLDFGGPVLSHADRHRGLLVLDGTWRLAECMQPDFGDLPVRSLPPLETAYPRVSKLFDDPRGGLATIEALYAAYRLLGREAEHLLEDYHWAEEFHRMNEGRL